MTDAQMARLCAEALGLKVMRDCTNSVRIHGKSAGTTYFNPISNDANAMAVKKHFKIASVPAGVMWEEWRCFPVDDADKPAFWIQHRNLNRAITECAARVASGGDDAALTPQKDGK